MQHVSVLNRTKPSKQDRMFAIRLMEHLVVPTFVIDPQHRVLIWNRACERLTGLPASEVVGTRHQWRGFYETPRPCLADLVIENSDLETYAKIYATLNVHEQGNNGLSAENWCVLPRDNARRYLALDAGPIYSEDGELLAVVETIRDMTVQHEAQAALEALVGIDGLTGIANRRNFDQRLTQELHRSERENLPVSLLMLDIDHFKLLNDTRGHQYGDKCLQQIAKTISGQLLRTSDFAARYGGEEFAVILPGSPLTGALSVADRILTAISAFGIPHPSSPDGPSVTLSIGVASSEPAARRREDQLIEAADGALYRAKHRGRNCVSV